VARRRLHGHPAQVRELRHARLAAEAAPAPPDAARASPPISMEIAVKSSSRFASLYITVGATQAIGELQALT
jgi:hypothetical protein